MKTRLIALFVLLASTLVSADTPRHTITHQDLWLLKRVGTPVASPDGKWAVFPVTAPAYDATDQTSDLWIVPLTGQ